MKLNEALQAVAEASFYEDLLVTPLGNGEYAVSRTHSDYGADSDEFGWHAMTGFHHPDAVETAGVMEPCEVFYDHRNIGHYLPESVEHLEEGHPVEYAYTVIRDWDVSYDIDGSALDQDGELTDDIVGWTLTALPHTVN